MWPAPLLVSMLTEGAVSMLYLTGFHLDIEAGSQVTVLGPYCAVSLSQLLTTLMPADRKQLFAPTGLAVVSAADLGLSEPPFPNPHPFPTKGQCGSSGLLLHDGIYSAAPFGWFGGMLGVCPLPSVGQWSEEEYQSCIEEGAGRGLRGSCLIGQSRGALSLSHG